MPYSERLQHLVKRFEENLGCEIEATERESDSLVDEVYGLREEDVRIVEGKITEQMKD